MSKPLLVRSNMQLFDNTAQTLSIDGTGGNYVVIKILHYGSGGIEPVVPTLNDVPMTPIIVSSFWQAHIHIYSYPSPPQEIFDIILGAGGADQRRAILEIYSDVDLTSPIAEAKTILRDYDVLPPETWDGVLSLDFNVPTNGIISGATVTGGGDVPTPVAGDGIVTHQETEPSNAILSTSVGIKDESGTDVEFTYSGFETSLVNSRLSAFVLTGAASSSTGVYFDPNKPIRIQGTPIENGSNLEVLVTSGIGLDGEVIFHSLTHTTDSNGIPAPISLPESEVNDDVIVRIRTSSGESIILPMTVTEE